MEKEITEKGELLSKAIQHRATWFARIYMEMKDAGIDPEPILRKAVKKTGLADGEKIKAAMTDKKDLIQFANNFHSASGDEAFGVEYLIKDKDQLKVAFYTCPLIDAWKKLDLSEDDIDLLCDMAMDGDRGIAEAVGLDLKLKDRLGMAHCEFCDLTFKK